MCPLTDGVGCATFVKRKHIDFLFLLINLKKFVCEFQLSETVSIFALALPIFALLNPCTSQIDSLTPPRVRSGCALNARASITLLRQ